MGNPPFNTFIVARANDAPSISNTMETVVEVGKAKVLKISNKIMSVTITAKNRTMISSKKKC